VNLGVNWISAGWQPAGQYNTLPGSPLTGAGNVLTGTAAPFDTTTFVPVPGSQLIDKATPAPSPASQYPVSFEYDRASGGVARPVHGAAPDLGAIEAP